MIMTVANVPFTLVRRWPRSDSSSNFRPLQTPQQQRRCIRKIHPAEALHAALPQGHAECYSCGRSHSIDGGPLKLSPAMPDCPFSRTANTFNQYYALEHHHLTFALKLSKLPQKRRSEEQKQTLQTLLSPFETTIWEEGEPRTRMEARPLIKDDRFLLYTRWYFRAPFSSAFFEGFRICPHNQYTARNPHRPEDLFSNRIKDVASYARASYNELQLSCKRCATYFMFMADDWNQFEMRVWQDLGSIWDDNAWRIQTHEGHRQRIWLPEKGADVLNKFPTYAQDPTFGRPATTCLARRSILDCISSKR